MLMRRAFRVKLCIVGTLAVLIASTVTSSAAPYWDNIVPTLNYDLPCVDSTQSDPNYLCQTDNTTLVYYQVGSVSVGMRDAVHATMNGSYTTTDLNASETSTPAWSGSAETDIVYWQDSTLPSAYIGLTWCDSAVSGSLYRCDQQYVKFRTGYSDRSLACHETGHAVGLTHGDIAYPSTSKTNPELACMITPNNPANQFLGGNNVISINSVY